MKRTELSERYGVYAADGTFLIAADTISDAKRLCPKGGGVCEKCVEGEMVKATEKKTMWETRHKGVTWKEIKEWLEEAGAKGITFQDFLDLFQYNINIQHIAEDYNYQKENEEVERE